MIVTVRPVTETDVSDIADLPGESGFPAKDSEVESRLIAIQASDDDVVLVAEGEGRVVGCMSLHLMNYFTFNKRVCRITTLIVDSSLRNQGIGKELILAAESFARQKDCLAIEVTSADYRTGAHQFYAQLGYPKTSVKFFKIVDSKQE
jgi:predicted N-acetyltransferase YhbS